MAGGRTQKGFCFIVRCSELEELGLEPGIDEAEDAKYKCCQTVFKVLYKRSCGVSGVIMGQRASCMCGVNNADIDQNNSDYNTDPLQCFVFHIWF